MKTNQLSNNLKSALLAAAFLATGFMAAHEADAKEPPKAKKSAGIEIIGKTADKKYNVYKLEGDFGDPNYFSNGKSYRTGDLFGEMDYIKKEDVNANGYKCEFVCKDRFQNVVGINPNFAFLAPKK